jgi:hypothetical protein
MNIGQLAGAAFRALTAPSEGPTLYDICDPLLLQAGKGAPSHLARFYHVALRHPALRLALSRAGLPQLRDQVRLDTLCRSLVAARDDPNPDWRRIGSSVADLLDAWPQSHPRPSPAPSPIHAVPLSRIEQIIRACATHLLRTYAVNEFIPAYAAFNQAGDPDFRGRDLLIALEGLEARTYKHATLLFNLARPFILASPPASALLNPGWAGVAEPMWEPIQIRHRSAYYDAFFAESLMDYRDSGLASPHETSAAGRAIEMMIRFCLDTSREQVRAPESGRLFEVVTALAPKPHSQLSEFFWQLKHDIGFGLYVPDCDTTACALSAAAKSGAIHPILDQPLLDLYAEYQVGHENRCNAPTVTINDHVDFDGGVVTWIENVSGDRPYGNDLDPTLNLDVLETSFVNAARWRIADHPRRLETVRRIIRFQARLAAKGAFADPRSHIYYLPELYCAYVGRCYEAFLALPPALRAVLDPEDDLGRIRRNVLTYVQDELLPRHLNAFDAALALLALARLGAAPATFAPALACLDTAFGEGRRLLAFPPSLLATPPSILTFAPYKAYEWNKMKTPTRILVGGPEVTSAFALSALVHARKRLRA